MPLPGHLWFIEDQYGAYWNSEPELDYVHAWYYRRKLAQDFPQFQFRLVVRQRDPKRPVPIPYIYSEMEEESEKERVKNSIRDSTANRIKNSTRNSTASQVKIAHAEEDF